MKLTQKVSFGPEACELEPKVAMWAHLEIYSKGQFGTRNVRNVTKSRDLIMSGPTVD